MNSIGRTTGLIAAVIILASMAIPEACHAETAPQPRQFSKVKLQPDTRVREAVAGIRADHIASITFPRLHAGETIWPEDPAQPAIWPILSATITYHRLIGQFLRAMQHAEYYPSPSAAQGPADMTITFRKVHGKRREDLSMELNWYYFGPEFFKLFLQLPRSIAQSARTAVHSSTGHVSQINIYGRHITDRQEINRILHALSHVTGRAFDLYADPVDNIEIVLVRRDGSVSSIVLAPGPLTSGSLPAILLPYCRDALKAEQAAISQPEPNGH